MTEQALSGVLLPPSDNDTNYLVSPVEAIDHSAAVGQPEDATNPARIFISAKSGSNGEDSSQRKIQSAMEVIARAWHLLRQLPLPNFDNVNGAIEEECRANLITRQVMSQRIREIRASYFIDKTPWHRLDKATVVELLHFLEFRLDLSNDNPERIQAKKRGATLRRHPSTLNLYISILKGVAKEAWLLSRMDINTYQAIASVQFRKNNKEAKGRMVKNEELAALLMDCDQDKQPIRGLRDAAILSVMRGAGLRRKEVVSLRINHFVEPEDGSMPYLSVIAGKGNKDRQCFITKQTVARLHAWLSVRAPDWLDPASTNEEHHYGFIFVPVQKGAVVSIKPPKAGTNWLSALSPNAIRYILEARCKSLATSGVLNVEPFSPHDLRRSYCTDLLSQGMDVFTVQKLMGHADVATTRRYDLRDDTQERDAVTKLGLNAEQGGYL